MKGPKIDLNEERRTESAERLRKGSRLILCTELTDANEDEETAVRRHTTGLAVLW